jgi:trigger factor
LDVHVKNLSEVSREVEITATSEELQPYFDKALQQYQPKVEVKGFRKGKVPLHLVKRLYGDLIEQESLETVANELYRQTVVDRELKPIGESELVDMNYKRGEQFWFKIKYDIRPTVELKEYTGFEVEKPVHTVTDAEMEQEILRLRRVNSSTEPAERVEGDEFIVTADVQELDETGMPIIGKKNAAQRFYLADENLEQPIKDALRSAEPGSEHRVTFEHQHGDHVHTVHLKISATGVDRVTLPEVDDAFVAKITNDKVTSVEDFRKSLREDLEAYWKEKSRRQLINNIVGEILRRHEFEVPPSLTRSVLKGLLEEIRNQYPNRQLPDDFDVERFAQGNLAYAVYQARWALLREEIVKAEGLTVEAADLTAIAEQEAPKLGIDKERLINYYQQSEQIKDRVLNDKLMQSLIARVKVKEVERSTEQF